MCVDMPKFGGPGKKKKKCLQRLCEAQNTKLSIGYTQADLDTLLPSKWLNDKVYSLPVTSNSLTLS